MRQSWAHKRPVFRTLFDAENSGESPGVFSVLLQKMADALRKIHCFCQGERVEAFGGFAGSCNPPKTARNTAVKLEVLTGTATAEGRVLVVL